MIRPLHDINDEFRAEIAVTPSPAQGVGPQGGNDDVANLLSSFAPEAEPELKAEPEPKANRKLPRYILPIAVAIVAIILILIAVVWFWGGQAPTQGDAAGRAAETQDAGNAEDAGDADAGPKGQSELGEGEYNSALENLEREIEDMRESEEENTDAASGETSAYSGAAVLYRDLLAREQIDAIVSIPTPDALLSRETKQMLVERIDARFADNAGKNTVSLPTDEEINSDTEFTNLTEAANALVDAVNAGRESGSRLPEVIDLRARAYAIYPIKVLKKLLAIDCEDFGLYCALAGRPAEESFDSFINAVKYRTEHLYELRYGSDAYYAEIRRIGKTYAEIAEIGGLDAARKRHASLIADCLYELAS